MILRSNARAELKAVPVASSQDEFKLERLYLHCEGEGVKPFLVDTGIDLMTYLPSGPIYVYHPSLGHKVASSHQEALEIVQKILARRGWCVEKPVPEPDYSI